ncbi:MAG: RluA family pseudouridine synthase [Deltaproteobacteria bacterium]|nr:RluA family pseudouridine synthase [Deltaproteobacteria bacterium]
MPEKIIIKSDTTGERIDKFLSSKTERLSRQKIIELIKTGNILLNDVQTEPSQKIKEGDIITVNIPDPEPTEITPQNIQFETVYEDDDMLIINKPSDLVVHPACGHKDNTLVNALLFKVKSLSAVGGEVKPGIVHRLDKGTSGLMIVAKNDYIHLKLSKMFERHTIKKFYRLISYNVPKRLSDTIETLYGRDNKNRKKFTSRVKEGKRAITIYKTLETFGKSASYIEAQIITGRTHQIRVHFSEMGCPIIGDDFYSRRKTGLFKNDKLIEKIRTLTHPLLHSYRIEFTHPLKQKWMVFSAEPPDDFREILSLLRESYAGKK